MGKIMKEYEDCLQLNKDVDDFLTRSSSLRDSTMNFLKNDEESLHTAREFLNSEFLKIVKKSAIFNGRVDQLKADWSIWSEASTQMCLTLYKDLNWIKDVTTVVYKKVEEHDYEGGLDVIQQADKSLTLSEKSMLEQTEKILLSKKAFFNRASQICIDFKDGGDGGNQVSPELTK